MSRIRIVLLAALFVSGVSGPLFSAEVLSVQVKQGQVRSSPAFLGSVTATLAYGDRVEVIEDKGVWKRIAIRNIKGWMHASALTAKTVALQAGKADVRTGATSRELALAGKGFNPKVEADFKSKNRHIDYAWVDRMEAFGVKSGQMQAFLKQGQIQPPEGGGR